MLVSRGSRTAALAACATILLATSACGSDKPEETTAQQARLYGTDGNMLNSFPAELKDRADLVNGMKGTTPATPLPEEFKSRLQSVDPKLGDYLYSAETYDAIVISALAAQLAGSTDSVKIAQQVIGVTNGGERCENVAACMTLAQAGQDIEYRGVSLTRSGFTDAGEPATTSYATLHFDDQRLNDGKTEFVGAGDESAASTKAPPKASKQGKDPVPGTPLVIAGLFPKTGDLALAYPPMAAGATLAIEEINAAGGVLGKKVTWLEGDDGASATKAKATVAELIGDGADVIIGAASSGITLAVLPETVRAGKILFSPSSTDDGLTTAEDDGLFFRTAPPDSLQGRALADVILRDGSQRIAIVARKDSYGEGLQAVVKTELENAGIAGDRIKLLTYVPAEGESAPPVDFATGAEEVKDFGADAVLVIGFGESAQVIRALADAGMKIGN
ncbi:ABC transporter substrate-binding protein [Micromonospora sp. NPDC005367]|uniref:ABC transporter substrate-binding protein n=1 Tax=Micromonospora sp. NPDC005367 TaxID=3155590 RepID=UPI0033BBD30A